LKKLDCFQVFRRLKTSRNTVIMQKLENRPLKKLENVKKFTRKATTVPLNGIF